MDSAMQRTPGLPDLIPIPLEEIVFVGLAPRTGGAKTYDCTMASSQIGMRPGIDRPRIARVSRFLRFPWAVALLLCVLAVAGCGASSTSDTGRSTAISSIQPAK